MQFDPEIIVIQAASTEQSNMMIEALMDDVLRTVHADESAVRISTPEKTFGWNFYMMSVNMEVARQLAHLPESGILDAKGGSLEQKFVSWLNLRAKTIGAGDKVRFNLLSDLKSSRYGLF
jgi:hypothetical protein